MKANIFLLLLLLPLFLPGQSDECARYDDLISKAQQALQAEDYQTALFQLQAATNVCYEKSTQAYQLIREVFEAMEIDRRKAKQAMENAKDDPARFPAGLAAYLTAEAQRAFVREDIRLAWRLTLEALEQDPANDKAQHLKQELPAYGADTYLGVYLTPADSDAFRISPDSTHFSFFSPEADGGYTLNVLELGGNNSLLTFPNSGIYTQYYNWSGRYLAFLTNLTENKLNGTLNVLDLQANKAPQTFPNSFRYYNYWLNGRYLVFFTNIVGDHGTLNVLELGKDKLPQTFPNSDYQRFALDNRHLLFYTNVADGVGTLNVLEMGGDQPPQTFPNSDYRSDNYSPDRRHLIFSTRGANRSSTLNVLELGGNKSLQTFPNSSYHQWKPYSPDGRRLVFHTNVVDGVGTLNVLELGSNQPSQTFPNSDCDNYQFSLDSRHLVFYTNLADGQGALNVRQRLFGKKEKKKKTTQGYSLNVLELEGDKPPQTFPNSYSQWNSYSPDGRYLVFLTDVGTLSVLDLGGNTPPLTFPNSGGDDYRYSPDGRYLVFLTNVTNDVGTLNVLELGGNQSPLAFSNCSDNDDVYRYQFSPDGRHLVFHTNLTDDAGTLNVLELGGNRSPLTFPNCGDYNDVHGYRFSPDGRHLVFFTNVVDDVGTLNVLKLGEDKAVPQTFSNCDLFDRRPYSPDSRHLVFFTNVADNMGTLNVLELGAGKPSFTFPNCHSLCWGECYNYSPDGRRLVFFTNVTKDEGTLNVLELEEDKSFLTFPKSDGYSYRNRNPYSPDSRHIAILAADGKTINIFNLDSKKVLQQIKNQYSVIGFRFLNNTHIMVLSWLPHVLAEPDTINEIYKVINLERIGEGYWDYLTKERYAPLTAEEKRAYGIVE